MIPSTPWLLPEYIEDILPGEALTLESLRRTLIDHLSHHGYQWISPPQLEYLDTLLTGTGQDLGLRTFKVVDQSSGKTLGLRPDITPQAARIDAHLFAKQSLNRLCYCGTVHHAKPSALHDSREIWQLGAELYGSSHHAADSEVLNLLLTLAQQVQLKDAHLDIGHVGLFATLTHTLADELKQRLFEALQAKDFPRLEQLTQPLDNSIKQAILALGRLYGLPDNVLPLAREALRAFPEALKQLETIQAILTELQHHNVTIHLDLAELRGYHYHTGLVFALYTPSQHRAIALGGRYDLAGDTHLASRPATGFSIDLRALALCTPVVESECIVAPYEPSDHALQTKINTLRTDGRTVWVTIPSDNSASTSLLSQIPSHATHQLVRHGTEWTISPLEAH